MTLIFFIIDFQRANTNTVEIEQFQKIDKIDKRTVKCNKSFISFALEASAPKVFRLVHQQKIFSNNYFKPSRAKAKIALAPFLLR